MSGRDHEQAAEQEKEVLGWEILYAVLVFGAMGLYLYSQLVSREVAETEERRAETERQTEMIRAARQLSAKSHAQVVETSYSVIDSSADPSFDE